MASTEAQKRAVKKAQSKCDAIMLRPPKEEGAAIRAAAAAIGQSNQQYILQATRERMERDGADGPQKAISRPVEAPNSHEGAGIESLLPSEILRTAQEAAQSAGETVSQFVERAVETQAKRDKASLALGINPATGGKLEKEA